MVREKGGLPAGRSAQASTAAVGYGRYQLLRKLATGGMAEVYLARQQGLEGFEKLLVVKRILPHLATDDEFVQMFLNEARIAARFTHPNIVQIYDLGKIEGTYFIGMEYVHGEDLGRVMRQAWNAGTWVRQELSLRIIAGACEGLHYAHTKADEHGRPLNVVHRDISPQNILVSFDGGVKIVDFGIAKAADSSTGTRNGTIKGKYAYMSPEQAQGKQVDNRTDVFALGLVLYEMLTGLRPLKKESDIMTLQAALACEIMPPSQAHAHGGNPVPESLDPVVMRALARDVDDRYASAREFQLAIEDYLVHERLGASSVHLSEFMRELFAERLAEEARSGKPMPSVLSESHQSFPALPAATGPIELPDTGPAPRRSTQERRRSTLGEVPPPRPAEDADADLDPDDGPTAQEVRPPPRRTASGQQRRATGEVRRPTAAGTPSARTASPSRARSISTGGMPEAPPRSTGESRARDTSWKEADRDPVAAAPPRRNLVAVVAVLCLLALTASLVFRTEIQGALGKLIDKGDPTADRSRSAAAGLVLLTLPTNLSVSVEVNGELVGKTPVQKYPVKSGPVKVRYFDPGQGIDKTITLDVPAAPAFTHREDFVMGRVQFRADRSVADVFVNGKRIAQTGQAPIQLAEGEYDFEAKADNGVLEGEAHQRITASRVTFVDFKLHPRRSP